MASVSGGEKTVDYLAGLRARLKKATVVRAGFPEGSTEADGTSLPLIAAVQNFGAPGRGIPPRPFFTNAVRDGKATWGKRLALEMKAANLDTQVALERLGSAVAGDIALALIAITDPPLSPVTLLLRQRFPTRDGMTPKDVWKAFRDIANGETPVTTATGGKPLVWSGQMLQHLQGPQAYEVE